MSRVFSAPADPTRREVVARLSHGMSIACSRETQIVADPVVPLVRIVREFDASPAEVFRPYTDPELVVRWLEPRRATMRIAARPAPALVAHVKPALPPARPRPTVVAPAGTSSG